jgi:hypothetical protein
MYANFETTGARNLGSLLRDVVLVLATTATIVTANAGESVARVNPPAIGDAAPAAQPVYGTYPIVSGDNLTKIAAGHGLNLITGWRLFDNVNPSIMNPDLIMPDHQLRILALGEQVPPRPLAVSSTRQVVVRHVVARQVVVRHVVARQVVGESIWDRLAQCESGGNWSSNVGTFDGGLQFHPGTWRAYGGTQYAPAANQATREQQITVAQRVLAAQGWGAWPACSRKLGLR